MSVYEHSIHGHEKKISVFTQGTDVNNSLENVQQNLDVRNNKEKPAVLLVLLSAP